MKVIFFYFYFFETENFTWTKIEINKNDKPLARCSYTMVSFGSEIYIFGGSILDFEHAHEDIVIYNTCKFLNYYK